MSPKTKAPLSRRQLLQALSLTAAGGALSPLLAGCREGQLSDADRERLGTHRGALDPRPPRFLIVIGATGGASLIDSFLAVRASESANASLVNTFPDVQVQAVADSPFRAVQFSKSSIGNIPFPVNANQLPFVNKHKANMLVATSTGTSVNHALAQKRSITGNAAWKGRTLQESMAMEYGAGFPLPNVNMGTSGYLERGTDDTLPAWCYPEVVSTPSLWPLGLHGAKGIKTAPASHWLTAARKMRNEQLDAHGVFARTFEKSDRLRRWYEQRGLSPSLEEKDLIRLLNILPDSAQVPLTEYGLGNSPDAAAMRAAFPGYLDNPFEGQAALAFLLLKHRVSCAVTIAPTFNVVIAQNTLANPPLAFDISHNDHRAGQALMWQKTLSIADKLIDLLAAEPFDLVTGESLWDRTLIYVATDFGRTRGRPADVEGFSSGHDFNNGFLVLSPLVKGNTVLGGVDTATTRLHGWDITTGAPKVGDYASNEPDIYSGILGCLEVNTSGAGLADVRAFRKTA